MIENLETIYKGKATIIKDKQYFSAKDYIKPFVEKISPITNKFICSVKQADQNSIDTNNNIDIVYNKVSVMGIFPNSYDVTVQKEVYHRVVVMVYALDVRNPVAKFYTGLVDSDLNLYAFSENIFVQEIEPEMPLNYSEISNIISSIQTSIDKTVLEQLSNKKFDKTKCFEKLGEWVDFSIQKSYTKEYGSVKLANSLPISVYTEMFINQDSEFYSDANTDMITLYKAFVTQISKDDKDIINRFEKTMLINKMLKL